MGEAGLYDRPVLVVDPGVHTAQITRADVDAAGRIAVTGSYDKTVRLWSVADGRLLRTIRVPAGPGDVGKIYAVALSPDGHLIAAGGGTGASAEKKNVFLFDAATGALVQRLEGLPNVVNQLAFTPDGRRLAATLGRGGVRVFARAAAGGAWGEAWRDDDYRDSSYGAAFASDGRLATTCLDGLIRLYDGQGRRLETQPAPGDGQPQPYGIAFRPPAGAALAVGYNYTTAVSLLDGRNLAALPGPDTTGLDRGDLSEVAWSQDGQTLYAGGAYGYGYHVVPVLVWPAAGLGQRRALAASGNTIMALAALPGGALLVAATDPWLGVLSADGTSAWVHRSPNVDFRGQLSTLAMSADGAIVDFGYEMLGAAPTRFDVRALRLDFDPPADGRTAPPIQNTLPVADWVNSLAPTLAGEPLPLEPNERSRSLAISSDGTRFVLGTAWRLLAFAADGAPLWTRAVPGTVWATNISRDGRLVVAACGDGTIRWHRMDDGRELLAFYPLADRTNWVAWTPEGFYAATPGAHGILRWHVNHGWDAAGEAIPVSEIQELRRPSALPLVLQELETARALGLDDMAAARRAVQVRTRCTIAPGARLHVLAIGVSDYGASAAHLRLRFADRDAQDVATALLNTQGGRHGLYADVLPQCLANELATRGGILRAFATLREGMARGGGQDLAVVLFSGHGAIVDDSLYLLVHGVDASTPVDIKATALAMHEVRTELLALGALGRVLVLLDCCHSGAATADGAPLPMNAALLRTALAGASVTVLTSSSAEEASWEDDRWQNGAFTEVFLEALVGADGDGNGLIGVSDLTGYLSTHVPRLTDGRQRPGVEARFESDLFAAAL